VNRELSKNISSRADKLIVERERERERLLTAPTLFPSLIPLSIYLFFLHFSSCLLLSSRLDLVQGKREREREI
jgi:hypothetical protein